MSVLTNLVIKVANAVKVEKKKSIDDYNNCTEFEVEIKILLVCKVPL